jgi:predicted DNA-binding protein (MmcQ/YjbR family)
MINSMRQWVIDYIKSEYNVESDTPFADSPETIVFRNKKNKKWFGIIIGNLPKDRLGLDSSDRADIINLKCDPLFSFNVVNNEGVFKAYHMNKEHWVSVLLDGSVSEEEIAFLINMSYTLVDKKNRKKK